MDGGGQLVVGDHTPVVHDDHDGFDEPVGVQHRAQVAAHLAHADGRVLAVVDIVRPDDHVVVGIHLVKQVFIFAEANAQDAFRGFHVDIRQLLRAAPERDGEAVSHIGADQRDHDRGQDAEAPDQHLPHGAFFSSCCSHRISPLKIWGHCTADARKAQRKSGAAAHRIRRLYPYPLTAPAVMPAIMYFCMKTKMMATGIMETTAKADR